MPANVVDEDLWEKAKRHAREQYPDVEESSDRFWALVSGIYKKSGGEYRGARKALLMVRLDALPAEWVGDDGFGMPVLDLEKARKTFHDPRQTSLFGGPPAPQTQPEQPKTGPVLRAPETQRSDPTKPPPGWEAIPDSKHGGYRKRTTRGEYAYWYPHNVDPKHAAFGHLGTYRRVSDGSDRGQEGEVVGVRPGTFDQKEESTARLILRHPETGAEVEKPVNMTAAAERRIPDPTLAHVEPVPGSQFGGWRSKQPHPDEIFKGKHAHWYPSFAHWDAAKLAGELPEGAPSLSNRDEQGKATVAKLMALHEASAIRAGPAKDPTSLAEHFRHADYLSAVARQAGQLDPWGSQPETVAARAATHAMGTALRAEKDRRHEAAVHALLPKEEPPPAPDKPFDFDEFLADAHNVPGAGKYGLLSERRESARRSTGRHDAGPTAGDVTTTKTANGTLLHGIVTGRSRKYRDPDDEEWKIGWTARPPKTREEHRMIAESIRRRVESDTKYLTSQSSDYEPTPARDADVIRRKRALARLDAHLARKPADSAPVATHNAGQAAKQEARVETAEDPNALNPGIGSPRARFDAAKEGLGRKVWDDPAHGRIEVREGETGKRDTWHNLVHGGKRYGWNGSRWARGEKPSQGVLDAVTAEGHGHLFTPGAEGAGRRSFKERLGTHDDLKTALEAAEAHARGAQPAQKAVLLVRRASVSLRKASAAGAIEIEPGSTMQGDHGIERGRFRCGSYACAFVVKQARRPDGGTMRLATLTITGGQLPAPWIEVVPGASWARAQKLAGETCCAFDAGRCPERGVFTAVGFA